MRKARYTPKNPLEAVLALSLFQCIEELSRLSGDEQPFYKEKFHRKVEQSILAVDITGASEEDAGNFRTAMVTALGDLLDP